MSTSQHSPEQLAIAGTFLLAQAINDRIAEKKDMEEASRFVAELLSLMLRAQGALLELPSEILPHPVRFPATPTPHEMPGLQVSSYPIMLDHTPIGSLKLFSLQHETPIALSDATAAQFALASLAKLAASALATKNQKLEVKSRKEALLVLRETPPSPFD